MRAVIVLGTLVAVVVLLPGSAGSGRQKPQVLAALASIASSTAPGA